MIEADILPTIFYGGLLLVLVVAVIAHWNKMGNIQRDLGRLEVTVAGLNTEIDSVETSLNAKIDAVETSLNAKIDAVETSLNTKIDAVETSLNTKIDAVETSLNAKIDTLQTSMDAFAKTQHEMQLQMQRNHYQLMMAILSHSHRPDGRPTFDLPPDFEPTSVPNDPDE
ncbi:MAG: hypothetical protein J4G13_07900 [Dehalococcoidia bacterium]|nr:hypothetical protein [Dehalococcoidia bacterium]